MKKFFQLIALSGFILFLTAGTAEAYLCWAPQGAYKNMQSADVVFSGKVIALESKGIAKDELGTERTNVTFAVQKIWKGLDSNKLEVRADTEALYEYNFKIGENYLVYGFVLYGERISMVGCPRVKTVSETLARELMALGDPIFAVEEAAPKVLPAPKSTKIVEKTPLEKAPAKKQNAENPDLGEVIVDEEPKDKPSTPTGKVIPKEEIIKEEVEKTKGEALPEINDDDEDLLLPVESIATPDQLPAPDLAVTPPALEIPAPKPAEVIEEISSEKEPVEKPAIEKPTSDTIVPEKEAEDKTNDNVVPELEKEELLPPVLPVEPAKDNAKTPEAAPQTGNAASAPVEKAIPNDEAIGEEIIEDESILDKSSPPKLPNF